jgi:hypothetical protein
MLELITAILVVFSFFGGITIGSISIQDVVRDRVVLYCIEKPDLCKQEYKVIKAKEDAENYVRPELP